MNVKPQFSEEQNQAGEFKRQEDAFRNWVTSDGSSNYPAVKDRYHLYLTFWR